MTIDFRALCAELADELDAETGYTKNDGERITHVAVARARATLEATPPPEPPTDEEILKTVRHLYGDQAAADMGANDDLLTVRAVLDKWGHG